MKARWAISMLFIADGVGFGVWAGHLAALTKSLQLTVADLTTVLIALVAGAILSMPLAGYLISAFGSRTVAQSSAVLYALSIASIGFASLPGHAYLVVAAGLFGVAKGALDVSINAQGATVNASLGTPIISSLQAFWSVGGLVGASLSSVALHRGNALNADFTFTAAAVFLLALPSFWLLLQDPMISDTAPAFRLPDRSTLRLGVVAFFGLFIEGSMADWGAVFLGTSVGVSASSAALGYATFAISMALGRFAGDWVIAKIGPRALMRVCGVFHATGMTIVLITNNWVGSLLGFALAGLGVANIVSIIFGEAGRNKTVGPGPALASVTTIGYFGFLAGPPMIGFIATQIGLRLALIITIVFSVIIFRAASALERRTLLQARA